MACMAVFFKCKLNWSSEPSRSAEAHASRLVGTSATPQRGGRDPPYGVGLGLLLYSTVVWWPISPLAPDDFIPDFDIHFGGFRNGRQLGEVHRGYQRPMLCVHLCLHYRSTHLQPALLDISSQASSKKDPCQSSQGGRHSLTAKLTDALIPT